MFNAIPADSALRWSFNNKFSEVRQLFRKGKCSVGGLTTVPHRHFDLTGSTDSPLAARTVPNGDDLTECCFVDFNAMYLWSVRQKMPLTPGIHWSIKNGWFHKQIMANQMSFSQIQWIQYLETTDICVDSHGQRHRIEHGYFRGEIEFGQIKPDGYLHIDNYHHFFEFLGKLTYGFSSFFPYQII